MSKPRKKKQFKGYMKIPIRTDLPEEEFRSKTVLVGDWSVYHQYIISKRRRYYINLYLFNSLGQKEVVLIHSPNSLCKESVRVLVEYAINQIYEYDDIDYDKSYMTVSC